ncbi:hypothetical protein CJ030_MR2G016298 [Morella rubra]|uniref:Cell division cycle protein 27 B n=1 Tax=Morella rubra TaxID=262757 RepID=A0A6A1WGH0_9ROSI|nr:hypothetical protein CJ030_MR2G016298 [Morella rubra]
MESILVDCVQNSLRHFMYRNAIFLCERLCAEFASERVGGKSLRFTGDERAVPLEHQGELFLGGSICALYFLLESLTLTFPYVQTNLQLLAGCYLHNNQSYAAYHILKGTQMAQSRYLFALSCFQMDLLKEAEAALCPSNEPGAEIPNGAAGHYLLGLIYRYTDRRRSAIHHFKQALSIDPVMWAAYEELCVLGAAEEATAVFGEAAAICIQKQYVSQGSSSQSLHMSNEDRSLVSLRNFGPVLDDASPRQLKHLQGNNQRDIPGNYHGAAVLGGAASQPSNGGSSNLSFYNTPSPMASQISGRLFSDSGPRRSTRLSGDTGANANVSATVVVGNVTNNSSKYLGGSKLSSMAFRAVTVRKSQSWTNENMDEGIRNEVFDDSRSNIPSTTSSTSSSGDTRSLEQEGATISTTGGLMNSSRVISGASEIMGLLRTLGEGYRLSCMYRCQEALDAYLKLPHKHYNTGWVLSQVGKAYFELVDYLEADWAFSLARQASPYSLEGMDTYSTVLYVSSHFWTVLESALSLLHLKEDMKLSYLAQELISTDRLAPQSWLAMGNCYSLQKDHETALRNFQRAVQLDPRFAYAHTLCGHEYVALEDFENGIKSYQSALQVDARHYNSWYGLGMIYLRQEKYEFSEHHFRMAFQINPRSSVIMSYLGTALHALKRSDEALVIMEKAILADKKNPLPMYQKASILVSLENFDEALEALEELKEYAPRESSVYALMGKIYKRRNMHDRAMLHFGLALDLKPPATDVAAIKVIDLFHS